jgi:hypothetical protein
MKRLDRRTERMRQAELACMLTTSDDSLRTADYVEAWSWVGTRCEDVGGKKRVSSRTLAEEVGGMAR